MKNKHFGPSNSKKACGMVNGIEDVVLKVGATINIVKSLEIIAETLEM